MNAPTGAWAVPVEIRHGTAGALHAEWPAADRTPGEPHAARCIPEGPAVVMGSTQPASDIDAARATAAGLAIDRRRSGGGAVVVAADGPVWIDVWVPRGHPRWDEDVDRAFDWIGELWVTVLDRIGLTGCSAHTGPYAATTRWSSAVCFGGVGRGEVVVSGGRKVVGLAQRRGRTGARFHCACLLSWDPQAVVDVLALDADARRAALAELRPAAVGLRELVPGTTAATVVTEFGLELSTG